MSEQINTDAITSIIMNVFFVRINFFYKAPPQRLLRKLKACCIGDCIIDWIGPLFTDRRQRVVVDGEVSNRKSVLSGVPQGSVL